MKQTRSVKSGDVTLHVIEAGKVGRPPLLLVHGFPDDHEVYSRVIDELARDFHVATFDLRGVSKSTAPSSRAGYRIEAILPDLTAVIDAVFGKSATVHLAGHDWGSVLCFSYVAEGSSRHRIRSFTSVSGPHVRMMWDAIFRNVRNEGLRFALGQVAASWYVLALHLPQLPELLFRFAGPKVLRFALERAGVPSDDAYLDVTNEQAIARTHGTINLYRQNALRPPALPAKGSINVPLRLVVPTNDPFVLPEVFTYLGEFATDLDVSRVEATHWMPRSHPKELAAAIREHAIAVDARQTLQASEKNR